MRDKAGERKKDRVWRRRRRRKRTKPCSIYCFGSTERIITVQ